MAAVEVSGKPAKRSRAEKKAQAAQSAELDKLKVVVRRLPPNLPEEIFWQSVQPWATNETVSWRAFYPGKVRKKYNKENVPSRAYITFRSAVQLAAFSQAYDGHVFRDKAGNESFAVVEFAPFQKIPSEKRKADPRMGTIEQDEDYLSFVQVMDAPTSKPSETDTLEALIAASQPPPQPKTTPLLDALRAEKQAQRDRETILKAHAHYRDREKGELGARRKGKQPQAAAAPDQDEASAMPGQGRRNRRGKKGDGSAAGVMGKAKAKETPSAISAKAMGKAATKPAMQEVSTASPKETAMDVPQERRPRPAIGVGLASRQFEAALAGAGVLPAGQLGQKFRREREREKKVNEADGQKTADKTNGKFEKLLTPASPGRERTRGGRKRGDSTKNPVLPAASSTVEATPGTTPTILSRPGAQPGILSRHPPNATEAPASTPAPGGSGAKQAGGGPAATGEGRGGRRRGRGRGTTRGGAPAAGA